MHQFVHHTFCTFRSRPCTTTTWNDQILSWLENGNSKAINFSISLTTQKRSLTTQKRFPLFSSNPTFLLSSTAVWLRIRAKKFQGTQSLFSAKFSLVTPLSDRKVPLGGNEDFKRRNITLNKPYIIVAAVEYFGPMRVHRTWTGAYLGASLKWLWPCYYQLLFKRLMTVNIPDKKLQLALFDLHDGGFTFRNQLRNQIVKKSLTFLLSE